MKRLIHSANEYVKKSDWKDLALIKLCVCSAGVMLGAALPKKAKKPVAIGAMALFTASYIPLATKFISIYTAQKEEEEEKSHVIDDIFYTEDTFPDEEPDDLDDLEI